MTEYRIGDEVTVRGIIKNIEHSRGLSLFVNMGYAEVWLSKSDIVTHTPKPREFKPGDMVTWGNGAESCEFIAARKGYAIVWHSKACSVYRERLIDIRHADEAE